MAVAIPEAFTYALQSRLPPNSFVVTWKQFNPDNAPRDGRRYLIQGLEATSGERVRLHLRGAPNEFLLNTNTYLLGSSWSELTQNPDDATRDFVFSEYGNETLLLDEEPLIQNGRQIDFFSGSRESFNSGALPYLDNQDTRQSHVFNRIRSEYARRNYTDNAKSTKNDLEGCIGGTFQEYVSIHNTPVNGGTAVRTGSIYGLKDHGRRFITIASALEGPPKQNAFNVVSDGGNNLVQIPLGYYSNLVNSHSVIPLGLMSSYSVNGWSIELTTEAVTGLQGFTGRFRTQQSYTANMFDDTEGNDPEGANQLLNWTDYRRYLSDIRIYAPVVQILDPAVMDSILSLYEKRQMVSLGGVQFPLSLRMNSLAFRQSTFPIANGTSDYHFRIAGTDRSVRALAWWVTSNVDLNNGLTAFQTRHLRLTRLQTKIGNEHIHEVVEDQTPNTDNVNNFINVNTRKSGALFSPLPQYMEGKLFSGQSEDSTCYYNNSIVSTDSNTGLGRTLNIVSTCCGLISFENLDRREGDHQGSYQASGKDLTNVGSIELDMRFNNTTITNVNTTGDNRPTVQQALDFMSFIPPDDNYQIHFAYCFDSIMEISPSGVLDVTSAVL